MRTLLFALALASAAQAQPLPLIPLPTQAERREGVLHVTPQTPIVVPPGDAEAERVGRMLARWIGGSPDTFLPVTTDAAPDSLPQIRIVRDASIVHPEGYALDVTPSGAVLRAGSDAGLFYAAQTLRQLLPPHVERQALRTRAFDVPAVRIADAPAYAWRGMMLDVSRHFFGPDDIRRLIDLMARYKLNRLHLHLSDDQGWRIEIPDWPRLATVGGASEVGGGPGGYLTLDEYDAIVAYAAENSITVVPEIDVPGHVNAAGVAYPWLSCADEPPAPYTGIRVGWSALCVDDARVLDWLRDVIETVAAHTPGPFVHIGGDEAFEVEGEAYARFMLRAQQFVADAGKRTLAWDELAAVPPDHLLPTTAVQVWRAQTPAVRAQVAASGADVILSPSTRAYLDMKYDSTTTIGLEWAGRTSLWHAFEWDPADVIEGLPAERLLGIEAPLWTETVATWADLTFLALPRLPALAHVGWTGAGRDWDAFRARIAQHGPVWEAAGYSFFRSPDVDWQVAR
jgi:hexosaminidase